MKKTTSATGKRKRTAEVAGKNAVPPGSKLPRTASYSQTDLFSYLTRPRPSSATVDGRDKPKLEIAYETPVEPLEAKEEDELQLPADKGDKGEVTAEQGETERVRQMRKSVGSLAQLGWRTGSPVRKAPEGWQDVWDRIVRFRADHQAPVDTMGCGSMADRSATPEVQRFQTLLGLMLSSQTRDQATAKAMRQMQSGLTGGVSVDSVMAASESDIEALIKPVTYYSVKARNIKKVAEILHTRYRDDIPPTFKGLTDLPGVGPKMSHLCMQYAWDKTEGIGVDVHVHRISNRLGWARTTTPEATRKHLEEWMPREHWKTINNLFVGFGQLVCTPTHPKCAVCPVNELCPTGRANLSSRGSAGPSER